MVSDFNVLFKGSRLIIFRVNANIQNLPVSRCTKKSHCDVSMRQLGAMMKTRTYALDTPTQTPIFNMDLLGKMF